VTTLGVDVNQRGSKRWGVLVQIERRHVGTVTA
jgi:hypothetical protein